jgi:hypothetical protein
MILLPLATIVILLALVPAIAKIATDYLADRLIP